MFCRTFYQDSNKCVFVSVPKRVLDCKYCIESFFDLLTRVVLNWKRFLCVCMAVMYCFALHPPTKKWKENRYERFCSNMICKTAMGPFCLFVFLICSLFYLTIKSLRTMCFRFFRLPLHFKSIRCLFRL